MLCQSCRAPALSGDSDSAGESERHDSFDKVSLDSRYRTLVEGYLVAVQLSVVNCPSVCVETACEFSRQWTGLRELDMSGERFGSFSARR